MTDLLKARFLVEKQAEAKGWKLLAWAVQGDGMITLCETQGPHPYVTHFFNPQDGGFYHGNYFALKTNAKIDFNRRSF
jgi:hypothetical protein